MSYILPVNANILSQGGADYNAVFFATAICSAIWCLIMGVFANIPVALSAGMGVNTFLALTVCGTMGYTFTESLAIVLLSGILFLIITLTPIREKIIKSIPKSLKYAVSAGLGIGLIAYCIMMLVSKRGKEVPTVIYGVALFFILNYLLNVFI